MKLADSKSSSFISRGDKSGTHAAELRYWKAAGIDAPAAKIGAGYKECGCGMGPALNIASSSDAYVLADRGTWLSYKNRGSLGILVEDHAGVAQRREVTRNRKRGRSPADQCDPLAVLRCRRIWQPRADVVFEIGGDTLEPADRHRLLLDATPPAGRFAGPVARAPQHAVCRHGAMVC